jgi:hypothetical protein
MQRRDSLGLIVAFGWAIFHAPCAMANAPAALPAMSTNAPPQRLIVDRNGAVLDASVAAAKPISLKCTIYGQRAAAYGRLAVVVDLDALSVKIEAPEKMPGIRWEYRNGQVARILTQGPPEMMRDTRHPMTMPTMQFVQLTPQSVVIGWRTSEGELGQSSSFNRSALDHPAAPCVWHTSFEFGLART